MRDHISATIKGCYFHLYTLWKLWTFLTAKAGYSISVALVLSRLDYWVSQSIGYHSSIPSPACSEHRSKNSGPHTHKKWRSISNLSWEDFTGCLWKRASITICCLWHTVASMAQLHSTSKSSFLVMNQQDPYVFRHSDTCTFQVWPRGTRRTFWLQFSSVQSPDRLGRRGTWETIQQKFSSSLFCRRLDSSSGMGRDVHHPAFPLPTTVSPTLLCALEGWFWRGYCAVSHAWTLQVSISLQ